MNGLISTEQLKEITDISDLKRAAYVAIRENSSLAHAIANVAEQAIDNGEMTERQMEAIAALASRINKELDQLSIIISEK